MKLFYSDVLTSIYTGLYSLLQTLPENELQYTPITGKVSVAGYIPMLFTAIIKHPFPVIILQIFDAEQK
jgi:hypothetical protein